MLTRKTGSVTCPPGRKAHLAAYVAEAGQVTVGALAERLGVSIDTIRRDLDQLSAEGVLVRTYGGAVSSSTALPNRPGGRGAAQDAGDARRRIAALAASLVEDGSTIMINGGTTTLALARHLRHHRDLTVATNNLLVPPALPPSAVRDLYVFGGPVRSSRWPLSAPSASGRPAEGRAGHPLRSGFDRGRCSFSGSRLHNEQPRRGGDDAGDDLPSSARRDPGRLVQVRSPALRPDLRAWNCRLPHHRLQPTAGSPRGPVGKRCRSHHPRNSVIAQLRPLTFARSRSHPDLAFVIFSFNSTRRGLVGRRVS